MACLLLPLFLVVLLLGCLWSFYRKKWRIAVVLLFVAVLLNEFGQIVSIHFPFINDYNHIKVMTFNVNSSGLLFDDRSDEILNLIEIEDPDFLYLAELAEKGDSVHFCLLQKYAYTNQPLVFFDDHLEPIYSKWPFDTAEVLTLPYGFHSIVRIQINRLDDTLSVYCCHLSSNLLRKTQSVFHGVSAGVKSRAKEADMISEELKHDPYPAIILGDLNDISGSYTLRKIESSGMKDAWWKGGLGYGATYHDHGLLLRLDHILYDDSRLQLCGVKTINRNLSDHNAVVASFRIRTSEKN